MIFHFRQLYHEFIQIVHFLMRRSFVLSADIIVWTQAACSYLLDSAKNQSFTKAIALYSYPVDENAHYNLTQVHYRIGNQKYTVIVDDPIEPRPKIEYAAFEGDRQVLECTKLIDSLAGPNRDFHKRTTRPKDILDWYFPEEKEFNCETTTLIVLFANSNTLEFDLNAVIRMTASSF